MPPACFAARLSASVVTPPLCTSTPTTSRCITIASSAYRPSVAARGRARGTPAFGRVLPLDGECELAQDGKNAPALLQLLAHQHVHAGYVRTA